MSLVEIMLKYKAQSYPRLPAAALYTVAAELPRYNWFSSATPTEHTALCPTPCRRRDGALENEILASGRLGKISEG